MARQPRFTARKASARRRAVSPLALAVFLLVAGLGAGVAWLSLTYEPPLRPGEPGNEVVIDLAEPESTSPPAETAAREPPATPSRPPAGPRSAEPGAPPGPPGGEPSEPPPAPAAEPGGEAPAQQPAEPQLAEPAAPSGAESPEPTPEQPAEASDQPTAEPQVATRPAEPEPVPEAAPQAAPTPPAEPAPVAPPATEPAPEGLPQRQPLGERQAMQLDLPPSPPGIRPRVAVVLTGLGLSKAQTTAAIHALPANITFAFSPYGRDLQDWADAARQAGHEVLLEVPMEPARFPDDDPGPHTLLTSLPEAENLERLQWLLGRFQGFVGVTTQRGGTFTGSPEALRPVLAELKKRGLLLLDTRSGTESVAADEAAEVGLPHAESDLFLDETAARPSIQEGLERLERLALSRGSAIGIGYPYPVTMELLAGWARTLEGKGIELLPVSALAHQPEVR